MYDVIYRKNGREYKLPRPEPLDVAEFLAELVAGLPNVEWAHVRGCE